MTDSNSRDLLNDLLYSIVDTVRGLVCTVLEIMLALFLYICLVVSMVYIVYWINNVNSDIVTYAPTYVKSLFSPKVSGIVFLGGIPFSYYLSHVIVSYKFEVKRSEAIFGFVIFSGLVLLYQVSIILNNLS